MLHKTAVKPATVLWCAPHTQNNGCWTTACTIIFTTRCSRVSPCNSPTAYCVALWRMASIQRPGAKPIPWCVSRTDGTQKIEVEALAPSKKFQEQPLDECHARDKVPDLNSWSRISVPLNKYQLSRCTVGAAWFQEPYTASFQHRRPFWCNQLSLISLSPLTITYLKILQHLQVRPS